MIVIVPLWVILLTTTLAVVFGIVIGWGFAWATWSCPPAKYDRRHGIQEENQESDDA